jgi:beta-glucanase (GH16 family)
MSARRCVVLAAMAAALTLAALGAASGCGETPAPGPCRETEAPSDRDGSTARWDAGQPLDSGSRDAGSAFDGAGLDGAPSFDAGRDDAGEASDVGVRDAGVNDAGPPDSGPRDAGVSDAASGADAGIDVPAGYQLVWSDEFDVDGAPNPKNWTYEHGLVRNHEAQWYQRDNARVQAGMLVLEARRERIPNPDYQSGSSDWKLSRQYSDYSSASLLTSGLHDWQYGRLEMRARIPTGSGMWPAWWTLGKAGEWPSNGEIDIMEYYRGNLLANVACGTSTRWVAKWDSSTKAISSLGSDWSSQFHVWRMDWDDQNIDLYVDGSLMNAVALKNMLNPDGASPFRQPHYMILNLAIGGDNGGDPASSSFPARYEIDYVRVFQKK